MPQDEFERSVFVNCPFDEAYAAVLEAIVFCVVNFGFLPRLANERLEAGENRLDKIVQMIGESKYSIHDLSRCKAQDGEYFRMNMPFEFGIDLGLRRSGAERLGSKKFLIFEEHQYDLKRSLSDIGGQDVEFHSNDYETAMGKVRDFFRVEAKVGAPGTSRLISNYVTFQGWMTEKKIYEGHSERGALRLPTKERIDEMMAWVELNRPTKFIPPPP